MLFRLKAFSRNMWSIMEIRSIYSEHSQMSIMAAIAALVVALTTGWILRSHYIASLSMKRKLNGKPPLPPGSLGLPYIGQIIQIVFHTHRNSLPSFLESREASYGPTFRLNLLGTPMVFLEPPAGNKFMFANEGKLVQSSWPTPMRKLLGKDSMTLKSGEEFLIARRQFSRFLNVEAVAKYLPWIERDALDHLAKFWQPPDSGDHFEISAHKMMKLFTFKLMVGLCSSLESGPEMVELEELFQDYTGGMLQLPVNLPGFPYRRSLLARVGILKIIDKLIARRRLELREGRATPTQDMLSCMLTQPDETGRMHTDDEVKDNILLLLFAGHDTSSSVLSMTIMQIAIHPQVRRGLEEEHNAISAQKHEGDALTQEDVRRMKYTWRVVQESMRVVPAVVGGFREALVDFEFNGYTVPKGWKLHWTNQMSHLKSKFFHNPEKFDPSRFETAQVPYTYLPFGGGPRLCPGNEFAKMEILVFLHHLVRKYSWILVDPSEPIIRKSMPRTVKGTPIRVTKL